MNVAYALGYQIPGGIWQIFFFIGMALVILQMVGALLLNSITPRSPFAAQAIVGLSLVLCAPQVFICVQLPIFCLMIDQNKSAALVYAAFAVCAIWATMHVFMAPLKAWEK